MKLFQCVEKSCEMMGISLFYQNQTFKFTLKTILILMSAIFYFCSSFGFLLFAANSAEEYESSLFNTCSAFASIANFSIIVGKMSKILQIIQSFAELIKKSMWIKGKLVIKKNRFLLKFSFKPFKIESTHPILKADFHKLNNDLVRLYNLFNTIILKFSIPAIILPALVVTATNYFSYDLGKESYLLPFPIVYVAVLVHLFSLDRIQCLFIFLDCHSIGKHRSNIWLV